MIPAYKKKANIAAGLWFVAVILLITFKSLTEETGSEGTELLKNGLIAINVVTFWTAFWAYAKAKGYSGFLGLFLPIFSIFGLIYLHSLRDKCPQGADVDRGDQE